eukprot:scaffold1771_cov384-Prasinococcus_capsulatus_cf.AAC.4
MTGRGGWPPKRRHLSSHRWPGALGHVPDIHRAAALASRSLLSGACAARCDGCAAPRRTLSAGAKVPSDRSLLAGRRWDRRSPP